MLPSPLHNSSPPGYGHFSAEFGHYWTVLACFDWAVFRPFWEAKDSKIPKNISNLLGKWKEIIGGPKISSMGHSIAPYGHPGPFVHLTPELAHFVLLWPVWLSHFGAFFGPLPQVCLIELAGHGHQVRPKVRLAAHASSTRIWLKIPFAFQFICISGFVAKFLLGFKNISSCSPLPFHVGKYFSLLFGKAPRGGLGCVGIAKELWPNYLNVRSLAPPKLVSIFLPICQSAQPNSRHGEEGMQGRGCKGTPPMV